MNKVDLTLYLITDSLGLSEEDFFKTIEAALKGGVTLVQLREKKLSSGDFYQRAIKVKELTKRFNVPLLINDRIDIALASGASGVHLGQSDIPIAKAREILGPDAIIGCTAKTVKQGIKAKEDGADYLGSGAIFASSTKQEASVTPIEVIDEIVTKSKLPVVAIGGLNKGNLKVLKGSKVSGVAISTSIMRSKDPYSEAIETFKLVKEILD